MLSWSFFVVITLQLHRCSVDGFNALIQSSILLRGVHAQHLPAQLVSWVSLPFERVRAQQLPAYI